MLSVTSRPRSTGAPIRANGHVPSSLDWCADPEQRPRSMLELNTGAPIRNNGHVPCSNSTPVRRSGTTATSHPRTRLVRRSGQRPSGNASIPGVTSHPRTQPVRRSGTTATPVRRSGTTATSHPRTQPVRRSGPTAQRQRLDTRSQQKRPPERPSKRFCRGTPTLGSSPAATPPGYVDHVRDWRRKRYRRRTEIGG